MQYTVGALVEPLGNEVRLDSICRTSSSISSNGLQPTARGKANERDRAPHANALRRGKLGSIDGVNELNVF